VFVDRPSEKPFRDPTMRVDAMYNYWGHKIGVDNTEEIIQSRMHDYRDDTNLSMINYDGFYADNISLPQMEGSFETGTQTSPASTPDCRMAQI